MLALRIQRDRTSIPSLERAARAAASRRVVLRSRSPELG
jgi:hypothetical protein